MTTPMDLARQRVAQLDAMGLFYCNELPWRCSNPRCRDCSTAVADICNYSGAGINKCSNSFSLAAWCFNAKREPWFADLYGHDLPGTFIHYEAAQRVQCMGFRGSNYGRNVDSEGDGHVEWILGQGKLSWGAHSHATGVGYDSDGLDTHQLQWWAVPPHFIPYMKPAPPIDWKALKELVAWGKRVSLPREVDKRGIRITGALHRGDRNHDVLIMNQLLHKTGYRPGKPVDLYDLRAWHAVLSYKKRNGWPKELQKGNDFGGAMVKSILR